MATTTTNFGWDIPQSTDLVKDGATAIAALGQDIDTALVDLKGGTTGQVLAKASGTDLDFTWASDASGIPATIFDAKGDIIAASAADTAARLAVGANDTVLTADSSTATGLKWATPAAGGMTSLASGTLSGASLDLTSISQSYVHLQLILTDYNLSATNNQIYFRINNESQNYYWMAGQEGSNSGSTTTVAFTNKGIDSLVYLTGSNIENGDDNNQTVVNIYNYAASSVFAFGDIHSRYKAGSGANKLFTSQWTYERTTGNSPVTQINLFTDSGSFSGGTYVLYGVK